MDWRTLIGGLAVAGVVASLAGVVVTLAGWNPLFVDSSVRTAAIASLALVVASIVAFTILGGPSDRWRSTPYW